MYSGFAPGGEDARTSTPFVPATSIGDVVTVSVVSPVPHFIFATASAEKPCGSGTTSSFGGESLPDEVFGRKASVRYWPSASLDAPLSRSDHSSGDADPEAHPRVVVRAGTGDVRRRSRCPGSRAVGGLRGFGTKTQHEERHGTGDDGERDDRERHAPPYPTIDPRHGPPFASPRHRS